jgi:hypothetical protein
LISQKGYSDEELPTEETIRKRLNELGYSLKKVSKTKPKKNSETDDIFENLKEVHDKSKEDETVLRLSLDAKDKVRIGEFARGGASRVETDGTNAQSIYDSVKFENLAE